MSSTPPGWYQDPYGRAQLRWWDGNTWGSQVVTNGRQFEDPPGPAPSGGTTSTGTAATTYTTSSASSTRSSIGIIAGAAAVALVVGALLGYLLRGDGDGGSTGPTVTSDARRTTLAVSTTDGPDTTVPTTDGPVITTPAGNVLAAPLVQGLSGLDAFEYRIAGQVSAPNDEGVVEVNQISVSGSRDVASDSTYSRAETTITVDGDTSTSLTESWQLGDDVCSFNPDGDPQYEIDVRNPFQGDIFGTLPGVLDMVVVSDNAELVGTEQVAGVRTRHYRFTVSGLGAGSGAQVTANEGELWVADDGDYVVRYQVKAGLRTAAEGSPDAEAFDLELTIELTSVNRPVPVTLPAECPAA